MQVSEYGVAVPYLAGTQKVPIKLLDYVDFVANKRSQGGKGGGNYNYEYYAAVDMMLCRGPVDGVGNIYDGGGSSSLLPRVETFTIGPNSTNYRTSQYGQNFYFDEGVTRAVTFSVNANDYGSDGVQVISGTQQEPMQKVAGAPASGQYSTDSLGHYNFSSADAGTTVKITYTYTTADVSSLNNRSPIQRYRLSLIKGTRPGTPWGYMATKHPERALSYPAIARFVSQSMDLGSTASTPNLSGEMLNARGLALGGGVADCDPAVVITDILTEPIDGCGWPHLGDLSQYSNFCVANRLLISTFFDSQRKVTDIVKEICDLTSAEAVWSGSTLKIVPYGDTTAVAYGRTFVPQNAPLYVIEESEFLCGDGEEAVTMSWPDLADNYNRIELEYSRRDHSYNTDFIREQDEASILMNGPLPKKAVSAHHFCTTDSASIAANLLLKRNAVPLRRYEGKLPWYYQLLEPMDIVVLNLDIGGQGATPVRLISVQETDGYEIDITAEDYVWGTGTGVLYPKQAILGNGPGAHDAPGATTVLAAFQPPARIATSGMDLWLALSGGANWGGCRVWLSVDGLTYSEIGKQIGSARGGTLTAALAVGADPDTSNTAAVSVDGTLTTVSQTDADSFATICLLGTELISYRTATLTGADGGNTTYSLSYLRRGVFGTSIQAHAAGEVFVRLDAQVFKYAIDPSLSGLTVSLKLTAFNLYGQEEQALSDVTAITVPLIGGVAPPTNLTLSTTASTGNNPGVGGNSTNSAIRVTWVNPLDPTVAWIQMRFRPSGSGVFADAGTASASSTIAFIYGVNAGQQYDVQIRSMRGNGSSVSAWVEQDGYTV